jgi:hypothetical protein
MQKQDNKSPADTNSIELEDDGIIKFAEELLEEDEDSGILELEENENMDAEEEDIIDLTEVAETQLQDDDNILDLTQDIEISVENEDAFIDLEDLTDEPMDTEETLSGPDDGGDNLTFLDDAVVDLNDVVEEISAVEKNMAEFEDTFDGQRLTTPEGLASEADTIELTDADRKALEAEFGYEAPIDKLTDPEAIETLTSGDVEEEILLDFNDDTEEEILEEVDLAADLLEEQPDEAAVVGELHEKLELSEADRRILEEELSFDTDEISETFPIDDNAAEENDAPLEGPLDTAQRIHIENSLQSAAQELQGQAEEMPGSVIEENGFTDRAFGPDMNGDPSAPVENGGGEEATPDDTDPFIDPEAAAMAAGDSEAEGPKDTIQAPEDFNFDVDETIEQPAIETDEIDFPPLTAEEERSVASLLAEAEPAESSKPSQKFGPTERDETDGITEEVSYAAPPSAALITTGKSDMDPDEIDADTENGGRRIEDPTSINEKETIAPSPTDGRQLFSRVAGLAPVREEILPDQLEAAVEKAVSKILADRIESMLFDAVDRAVAKEISRLKTLILGDHDPHD